MHRIALVALFAFALSACSRNEGPVAGVSSPAKAASTPAPPKGDPIEGLRVATRVGCNGCHRDNGRGGIFIDDPKQGRYVAPNLTQRRALYDDAAFAALLREGKTHDNHLPMGMPIKMFQHLSDQEVRDITAWLRALPAVENPGLPESKWSDEVVRQLRDGTFPYLDDMRPDPGNTPPAAPPSEPLALGKHLAMTSCGECHAWDLNGWPGDSAPSLIVAKAYTPESFARLMKTGVTAAGTESKTGLMSKMGRQRFHVLTEAEVAALKLYLDSR
jgi:mono/diheme cytochrome c family protein